MTGAEVPPEPRSDERSPAFGRIILEISIEKVSAVNYIAEPWTGANASPRGASGGGDPSSSRGWSHHS
jgi:hypothetical protein